LHLAGGFKDDGEPLSLARGRKMVALTADEYVPLHNRSEALSVLALILLPSAHASVAPLGRYARSRRIRVLREDLADAIRSQNFALASRLKLERDSLTLTLQFTCWFSEKSVRVSLMIRL
jgi:hypothetical protein